MEKQKPRLMAVDVVRGIAVILMITTHIWISFYWDSTNPLGTAVSYIGGYLSFSIFLIISGFTLGVGHHRLTLKKVLMKSLFLLGVYFALGLTYTLLQKKDIYTLFTSPIYLEEYLLTLALFPLVAFWGIKLIPKLPGIKKLLLHNIGAFFVLFLGLALVILGKYTAPINTNYFLSLFVGSSGFHTFPLLSYFVIYGVGIWLGWSNKLETAKNYGAESVAIILTSTVVSLIALPLENISFSLQTLDAIRWPPTLFFITSSLAVSASILYGATLLENSMNTKIGRMLQFIGKQALAFLIIHLILIYLLQGVVLAKISQIPFPTLYPTPTSISPIARIANEIETSYEARESWPFNGYKVAAIELSGITKSKQMYVEILPQEIDALGSGQDITLYAITKDAGVKKLSKNVISAKNNYVVLSFTAEPAYETIVTAFTNDIASTSLPNLQEIISKNLKPSGERLAKLDKNYAYWIHKPYTMEGKRWFIQETSLDTSQVVFKAYMPITCDDLELYTAQLKKPLTVNFNETPLVLSENCTSLVTNDSQLTSLTHAKSYVSIPFGQNIESEKSGKKSLSYTIMLPNINGANDFSLEFTKNIAISKPMYVAWTLDWEGINGAAYLNNITEVRNQNPNTTITHLFNPRIWNSSSISKSAADAQISYVKKGKDKYKDEISLHLHMFTDMVGKSGLKQLSIPGWGNFNNGYDIPLSEFSYGDSKQVFTWSISEFKRKGLPKPTSFRAGGWMMSLNNLRAAKDAGLLIDTSARTSFSTSSFNSQGHSYAGPWKAQITTQPYWVSTNDQNKNATKSSSLGIFEMPNNGGDSWAYSKETLLSRFTSNYSKEQLSKPQIVTYISHPDFFYKEGPKIASVLSTISTLQAINDDGPVIYTTLYDYYLKYAK